MATIDVSDIIKSSQPPEKRSRLDNGSSNGGNISSHAISEGTVVDDDRLQSTDDDAIFDEHAVRRLILQLEKRILKNREMRIKHSDEAHKFMDSELELNVAVQVDYHSRLNHVVFQEMHAIATQPDLYELLVENNAIGSLLQLLSHENTDIVAAVIDLLQVLYS